MTIPAWFIDKDNVISQVEVDLPSPPRWFIPIEGARKSFQFFVAKNVEEAMKVVTDVTKARENAPEPPAVREFYKVLGIRSVVYIENRDLATAFIRTNG